MTVTLRRIDPKKNMSRFYEIDMQLTLFGEFSVARHWGRIGTRGQSMEIWFGEEEEAHAMAQRLKGKKLNRGYTPLPSPAC